MRVLLIEDDQTVRNFVAKGLAEAGHLVEQAADGRQGLSLACQDKFDVIILDRMLPGGVEGLHILETLRREGNMTPVLLLSALADVDEKVAGLKAGGDDYVSKPFSFSELQARLEALVRRNRNEAQPLTKLTVSDLEIDLLSRSVRRGGRK